MAFYRECGDWCMSSVKKRLSLSTPLIFFGVLLAVVVLVVVLTVQMASSQEETILGPDNSGPSGSQALVNVASDQGIDVHSVTSERQFKSTLAKHPDATVIVHDRLGAFSGRQLEVVPGDQLVLVAPSSRLLESVTDGLSSGESVGEDQVLQSSGQQCGALPGMQAESISGQGRSYLLDSDSSGTQGCFPVEGSSETGSGTEEQGYGLVQDESGITVVGSTRILTNDVIDQDDNAALALSLMGQSDDVIWYLPGITDMDSTQVDEDQDLAPITARWVPLLVGWGIVVALLVMFWRGRRHGPVVIEPLPVEVSPHEIVIGRARLYERAGQYRAATTVLQRGLVRRLIRKLRLGRGASDEAVAVAVSRLTGDNVVMVRQLLAPRQVQDRSGLLKDAQELKDLEMAVDAALSSDFSLHNHS